MKILDGGGRAMSERDSDNSLAILLLGFAALFFIYALCYRTATTYYELRDLQRRVGQLESERR